MIARQGLLNFLQGAPCKLSHSKNAFAADQRISCSNAIPILVTGIRPIEYIGAHGLRDERETAMMGSRWRIFEFCHQIPNNSMQERDSYQFKMLA